MLAQYKGSYQFYKRHESALLTLFYFMGGGHAYDYIGAYRVAWKFMENTMRERMLSEPEGFEGNYQASTWKPHRERKC